MNTPQDAGLPLPSETLLRDVLESVSDAVVTIDDGHRVLICNKAAEDMFGYPRSEILGQDVSLFIPDPHRSRHREYVERYLRTGQPRVIGKAHECHGQRKNGTRFPAEISYSVSRSGGRLFFTAVVRDISQRKEIEKELRFMERLADTGKAVAQVSHEIRKPLMLIGGFARQLNRNECLTGSPKDRRKLTIIEEEVQRLETLLNGIRLLTRPPSASHKRLLSLNQLLEKCLELIQPRSTKQHIELIADLCNHALPVSGDPDQLKQVILNLLINAMEAAGHSGVVRVASSVRDAVARLDIEDNGPGIPEGLQAKIFEPFFTTKSEGSGLGLAISRTIVADHGGALRLHSKPDEGATFTLDLPLEVN